MGCLRQRPENEAGRRAPRGLGRHTVWKTAATVPRERVKATRLTYRIPVAFQIPALPNYDAKRSRWILHVVAVSTNQIDYEGYFDVPVFATNLAPPDEQRGPDGADAED